VSESVHADVPRMNVTPDFQITARVAGDRFTTFASDGDIVVHFERGSFAVDAEPLLAACA
jgi:hypothetical protein